MKTYLTLALINIFFYNQASVSQSIDSEIFNLLSLEGKEVIAKIAFDDRNDRLLIELNENEKMCILNAKYFSEDVKILDKKFIELQLGVRGGSGESVHRYVLICISGDRLYKCIDVISLVKNLVDQIIDSQVNFVGLREKNNSYEMCISGETSLQFDLKNKIFFNGYENLNGLFNLNSDQDLSNKQIDFKNEIFPMICVNFGQKYIFIRHKWYVKGQNHLLELTSFCY